MSVPCSLAKTSSTKSAALLQARRKRQRILFRNNPARFTFFVHERALRLDVGDHRIMAEQLHAMVFFADQWNITIRVLPASARDTALFGGSFRCFGYPRFGSLVYLDCHVAGLFLEDRRQVAKYQSVLRQIATVALDEEESRKLVATLADEYETDCVEVALTADRARIRDSKNAPGPVLAVDAGTWAVFVAEVRPVSPPAQRTC